MFLLFVSFFLPCVGSLAGLTVDPSLTVDGSPSLHGLAPGGSLDGVPLVSVPARATALIVEGLPPVPVKIIERIRRWEYMDLSQLIQDPSIKEESLIQRQSPEGVVIFQTMEHAQRRRKSISDIFSWTKAFSIYAAILSGAELTSKEESMGLWAHLHLITQLSKDMGGGQWLQYDIDYREWAAAKGIRKWGDLHLSIYGRCLSHRVVYSTPAPLGSRSENRGKHPNKRSSVCYPWNFDGKCDREESGSCRFSHTCYYCEKSHRAKDCQEKKRKAGK